MKALRRLLAGENDYDFTRSWHYGLKASLVLVVLSILMLALRGLNLGLDFEGGTAWEVPTSELSVTEARDVLRPLGQEGARIQTVGSDLVRIQSDATDAAVVTDVRGALAGAAQISSDDVAVTTVGPTWGREISEKAIRALVLFFIAIAVYITVALRDWRMAAGALTAVVHDIVISVGVYSLLWIEVTPATVVAFLTILGFSLYDTVVVFARIRENAPKVSIAGRMTYTEMASLSLNQVLMRSINTSVTTVLPVLSILVVGSLIFGATTLQEFGLALLTGLLIGVYSSIFVATPVTAWLNERSPTYRTVRERLGAREHVRTRATSTTAATRTAVMADADADADLAVGGEGSEAVSAQVPAGAPGRTSPPSYSAGHPPRPRKNRRR